MQEVIIKADHLVVKATQKEILKDLSMEVFSGEAWAITGPSGSGKTILGKTLAGLYPIFSGQLIFNLSELYKSIFIAQQHNFRNLSSAHSSYYQQRFDHNYGKESPLVEEVLLKVGENSDIEKTAELLKIQYLLKRRLIELSNGEGKRVQLAQALLQNPQLIIFDNPFIGLDDETRKILHEIINDLIQRGILLFVITSSDEIPEKITHILELESGKVKRIQRHAEFESKTETGTTTTSIDLAEFGDLKYHLENTFSMAVDMKHVNVRYGEKTILEDINWQVKKGEKWALLGPNGSGKSTLLSLINGDNPQAYSNEIYLFDRRRGSGESIWDIKKRIGYISPELHIYFQRDFSYTEALAISSSTPNQSAYSYPGTTCFEAIASGFNDQIGSSQRITEGQSQKILRWMDFLQISPLKNQSFYEASLGEQRLVLLARTMVKNPAMLILDEPCQGLDKQQTLRFLTIIDMVCSYLDTTLIYVSHYPQDIPNCVNKSLHLAKGKVVSIK